MSTAEMDHLTHTQTQIDWMKKNKSSSGTTRRTMNRNSSSKTQRLPRITKWTTEDKAHTAETAVEMTKRGRENGQYLCIESGLPNLTSANLSSLLLLCSTLLLTVQVSVQWISVWHQLEKRQTKQQTIEQIEHSDRIVYSFCRLDWIQSCCCKC